MGMEGEESKGSGESGKASDFDEAFKGAQDKTLEDLESELGIELTEEQREKIKILREHAKEDFLKGKTGEEKELIVEAIRRYNLAPVEHQAAIADFIFDQIIEEIEKQKGQGRKSKKKGKAEPKEDPGAAKKRREEIKNLEKTLGQTGVMKLGLDDLAITEAQYSSLQSKILREDEVKILVEKILGVGLNLRDKKTLKAVWRKKVQQWHPDKAYINGWTALEELKHGSKSKILYELKNALERSKFM